MAFKQPKSPIKKGGSWSEWGHGLLDVAGLVPGFGEIADGANALWYGAEGDKVNAALSTAAMVPFLGWGATATKLGLKAAKKLGKKVIKEGSEKAVKNKEALSKFSNKMGNNADLTKNVTDVKAPPVKDTPKVSSITSKAGSGVKPYSPKELPKYEGVDMYDHNSVSGVLDATKAKGSMYDNATINYDKSMFKEMPPVAGRKMMDVNPGNGLPSQRFYQSTGLAGKKLANGKTSKGTWTPLEGFGKGSKGQEGWFIKGDGWDKGYGSESFKKMGSIIDKYYK